MSQPFGHEKLEVYRKARQFVSFRTELLAGLMRKVAACDHLHRSSESVVLNIAHASSSWSPEERIVYVGNANGSALECAECLDVLVARKLMEGKAIHSGKLILAEIVSMLITMRRRTEDRIREDQPAYRTHKGHLFSHEDLDVYQAALQLIGWLEGMNPKFTCSADLITKLDKATTSIVLNIVEGNGRFTGSDQAKFLRLAFKATVHSASLLDLAVDHATMMRAGDGRDLLRRIAAMLTSWSKSVAQGTNGSH